MKMPKSVLVEVKASPSIEPESEVTKIDARSS